MKEKKVDDEKLEAVSEFCSLGDMISAGGGCMLAAETHCKMCLGKFHKLLPFSSSAICLF